jgi:hypothetical protein
MKIGTIFHGAPILNAAWKESQLSLNVMAMNRWEMDPSLRRILLHMISPLLTSPEIPLTNLADKCIMLLTTQWSIGDDSLLFGCFSMDWARLQDPYLRVVGVTYQKDEASRAIRSLITAFHDQCHVVWLLRNQHLHGTDPQNATSYKHLHLLAQIRELYDAQQYMMAHDGNLLAFTFECRHLQSTATLKAFYQHAKPLIKKSIEDATKLGDQFRHIDTYFRPVYVLAN